MRNSPDFNQLVSQGLPWYANQLSLPIHYQLLDKFPKLKNHDDVRKWVREAYTNNPDFYLIVRECVGKLINELLKIFAKAPPLKTEMTVFRGIKTWYMSEDSKKFTTVDFMSTSFDPWVAMTFAGNDCCLTQFNLKAGTKAIFLDAVSQSPGEKEVLLPPRQKFTIVEQAKYTDRRTVQYIIMDGV